MVARGEGTFHKRSFEERMVCRTSSTCWLCGPRWQQIRVFLQALARLFVQLLIELHYGVRAQLNREAIPMSLDTDKVFTGSIPRLYDTCLVPLIFEPYAADLVSRLSSRTPSRVLEIAAGTGVVTRALVSVLPASVSIIATDLNQAMLDHASMVGTKRAIEWRQADAMQLPFQDGTFDAVVCQFGVMFFPEKSKAFSEVRRVLRPGGVFIFNVWDRIKENEFADTVTTALESLFPKNPSRFLARTPHGYHDHRTIEQDLAHGGFTVSFR